MRGTGHGLHGEVPAQCRQEQIRTRAEQWRIRDRAPLEGAPAIGGAEGAAIGLSRVLNHVISFTRTTDELFARRPVRPLLDDSLHHAGRPSR